MDIINDTNSSTFHPFNNSNDFDEDKVFLSVLSFIQETIYYPIFCAGIANNLLTILIIVLNRDMHTITNCYLLNLAISDSLPLIVSLPFEIAFLRIKLPWQEMTCKFRSLLAETSTNASILTISAFTIERYLAVCQPLHSSFLSATQRAIKIQILIWVIAILSSTPFFYITTIEGDLCHVNRDYPLLVKSCFYVSATIFFVLPVFILCLLYALMARRLYSVGLLSDVNRSKKSSHTELYSSQVCLQRINYERNDLEIRYKTNRHLSTLNQTRYSSTLRHHNGKSLVISPLSHVQAMKTSAFKMLFAVVIAFIICYAPFHAQRLITSTLNVNNLSLIQRRAITIFYHISGILYYLGSTINPIFYHLFSRKYRRAFQRTMKRIVHCQRHHNHSKTIRNYFDQQYKAPPIKHFVVYANIPRTFLSRSISNRELNTRKQHVFKLTLPILRGEKTQ